MTENIEDKIIIECECGTHLLQVISDCEIDQSKQIRQVFYLAMYYYGIESHKRKFWGRVKLAFRYLRTGKMFSDQLSLTPDEANKLSNFIIKNKPQ